MNPARPSLDSRGPQRAGVGTLTAQDGAADGQRAAPQRLTPWFGVVGLLLLATLLAAGFVQVRQHALLNASLRHQDDYLVISLYQLETEYLRLREQLQREAMGHSDGELQLRYDVFVSRVGLLDNERARHLLAGTPVAGRVTAGLQTFMQHADVFLANGGADRLSSLAAQALRNELVQLGDPVHRLMLEASHQVAQQLTDRQEQVRQHNLVGLALTAFLSCVLLGFALIALHQMRALGERHTRLEELAEALRKARRDADAANAAKSDFLADISHELRTPLHGLMGMLDLLRDAPRAPQAGAWLGTAHESSGHLLRLLDDLLDLSKLESGALMLAPQPVAPAALLRDVQALMLPAARAKGLDLVVELDPALPARLLLDPTRVRQVLYNLLANAVKYSERGAVVLRCAPIGAGHGGLPDGAQASPVLEFVVADTGIGMDGDTLSRLFSRFARSDDPRARRQGGAGLGLAISRNLAALMGGEILVRSTPGAGSLFSFRCPLQTVVVDRGLTADGADAASEDPKTNPQHPAAAADAPAWRSLHVLVADDHPVNRLVLQALLERLGHRCHLAADGEQALAALRTTRFDLVLMDVHMPVLDGVGATRALRALPPPAGATPVLALTADVFPDTRTRCLDAGVQEVLTKPLSLDELSAVLARHLGVVAPGPAVLMPLDAATDATRPTGGATAALIDRSAVDGVRRLVGADRVPALYSGFFEQARDAGRRMRDAMRTADPEALARAAHGVKGAALNLGLPALADAAARLSRDAATLSAAPLAGAVQQYEDLVDATRRFCIDEGLLAGSLV